jgi:hypothetical protein
VSTVIRYPFVGPEVEADGWILGLLLMICN